MFDKDLLKFANIEVFEERRDFLRQLIEEAIEDMALAKAIEEDEDTEGINT